MQILTLGGTQFVGRHIVEACRATGHGDRDAGEAGLGALAGRSWDACVDVSGYTPRQVRASAGRLLRPQIVAELIRIARQG